MRTRIAAACLIALSALPAVSASNLWADVYELRTYTTHPGKLDDLNARFRDHTVRLFKRHGLESVVYWLQTDGEQANNNLI